MADEGSKGKIVKAMAYDRKALWGWRLKMRDRRIYFEKIQNIRDLGGLKTIDGQSIASGLLLRSANLSGATDSDVKKLKETYHLAKIIDLRTSMEKEEKPDVAVAEAEYLPVPIFDERVLGISHEKDTDKKAVQKNQNNMQNNMQNTMQMPVMEDLYRMIVTNETCRTNLGKAAQTVMEHDFTKGSVLWHCTEGKDRCGLLTAILLSALSVDRQQILEEYLLTNEVNQPKAQMYYQQMLSAGKSEAEAEAVKNVFLAKETYLNEAFSAIDEQYQDMGTYLTEGLNIAEDRIVAFREKMLEY